jgi:hypothetical protein
MADIHTYDPSRRDFLKKLGILWLWTLAVWGAWKLLYDTLHGDNNEEENESKETEITSLHQKPIDLWYHQRVQDKDLAFINFPQDKFSMLGRISRCLRWKPVTDAVEDRYHIPRGLLMAMMAQEGMGDPTMPNLPRKNHKYGDGWLGLIHIQAINAHNFWLTTMKRSTNAMCDDSHAKLVVETIRENKWNIAKLVQYDDRFHPIMAVDCAARFLMDCKKRKWSGTDDRIHALGVWGYSWRKYTKIIKDKNWKNKDIWYWLQVVAYRAVINDITWDWFPNNFSKNIYTDIHNAKINNASVKKNINDLKFLINNQEAWYEEYLAYFEESLQNFELEKYLAIGTYDTSPIKKDIKEDEWDDETIKNTMITSEFVHTKQHNSEWFFLYRYKVKKWDNSSDISDKFDERDKQHWDRYKNTWNLNVVGRNWKKLHHMKAWDVVYIKVRNSN